MAIGEATRIDCTPVIPLMSFNDGIKADITLRFMEELFALAIDAAEGPQTIFAPFPARDGWQVKLSMDSISENYRLDFVDERGEFVSENELSHELIDLRSELLVSINELNTIPILLSETILERVIEKIVEVMKISYAAGSGQDCLKNRVFIRKAFSEEAEIVGSCAYAQGEVDQAIVEQASLRLLIETSGNAAELNKIRIYGYTGNKEVENSRQFLLTQVKDALRV